MSLALKVFTENFIKGLQIGTGWQDKREEHEMKKAQAAAQLAHWNQQATWNRARLAETSRLNDAKIAQSAAYANYLKARAGAVGAKGGAGAGSNPGVGQLWGEFGENQPQPQQQGSTNITVQSDAAPPGDLGTGDPGGSGDNEGSGDTGYRRGGRVKGYDDGGAINLTSPMVSDTPQSRIAGAFMSGYNRSAKRMKDQQRQSYNPQTGASPTPITRVSSTQTYGGAGGDGGVGATGPGSGYGNIAAPPVGAGMQGGDTAEGGMSAGGMPWGNYRRGGRVQSFEDGGQPDPRYALPMTETEQRVRVENPDAGVADVPYERGGPRPRSAITPNSPAPGEHVYGRGAQAAQAPRRRETPPFVGEEARADEGGVSEEEQQRQAREARERNPSRRNWVPPQRPSGTQSQFVGEEARADESGTPPSYEPGDSGTPQPPTPPRNKRETQYGPGTEGPSPRRGGAISTGTPKRLLLGDQRRTAAYDPEADRMDPRNTGVVEPGGGVNERVYRGLQGASRDDNVGAFGERLDRPGAQPVPAQAEDLNYAMKGASTHATSTFGNTPQGQMALASGQGAATPHEMRDIFHAIDPDGQMQPHDRMVAATKAVHDYYMANGDPKRADQSAFEITQFGNQMAKQHGAAAAKALQAGDTNTAMQQLFAGYGWIPDGGTPHFDQQSNTIMITGPDGKTAASIPVQPGTLQNLALGMMSGQMTWDIVHQANGQPVGSLHPQAPQRAQAPQRPPVQAAQQPGAPPPAAAPPTGQPTGPAAQPAAAPAGPQAPPPAAPPAMSPETAATQQPGVPPPAPTPAQQTAPAAPPAAPPMQQTAPPAQQGIQTAPPTAPAAPPGPTATGPTAGAAAPPSQATAADGAQRAPAQGGGEQETGADLAQKHWAKNPYAPLPNQYRETSQDQSPKAAELRAQAKALQDDFVKTEAAIVKRAGDLGLLGGKKGTTLPNSVQALINVKKQKLQQDMKELQAEAKLEEQHQYQQDQRDITETKPRKIDTLDAAALTSRATAIIGATNPAAVANRAQSPLRYGAQDQETLNDLNQIARSIYQHNQTISPEKAYDLALTATSILPPGEVGYNFQKDGKATKFRPMAVGKLPGQAGRKVVQLQFGNGQTILVDEDAYNQIAQTHQQNWKQYETVEAKKTERQKSLEKITPSWKTLGAGVRTIAPLIPGVGPALMGGRFGG